MQLLGTRLDHVIMRNFRGLAEVDLDLSQANQLAVFAGKNASGKSSILDAIAILLQSYAQIVTRDKPVRFDPKLRVGDLRTGASECYLEAEATFSNLPYKWSVLCKPRGDLRPDLDIRKDDHQLKGFLHLLMHGETSDERPPLVAYYGALRGGSDASVKLPKEREFHASNAFRRSLDAHLVSYAEFFEWYRLWEDLENEQLRETTPITRDLSQLHAVRRAIELMLPGVSNLRVDRRAEQFVMDKDGGRFSFDQLSHGERAVLALTGDIARRLAMLSEYSDDPLTGPGIILIDEIELHLHPAWQRTVPIRLQEVFPNCQFLLTTHSPQVLGEIKPESIFLLETRADTGTIIKRPKFSYGRDTNLILEGIMGADDRAQPIENKLRDLFRLLDKRELAPARELKQRLSDEIGGDDPELARAEMLIDMIEMGLE